MRSNKKGFTIVELVIVIAVIAILAAVLIPTIAGLVKKANLSSDKVAVRNMNTALASEANLADINAAIDALAKAGFNSEDTLVPVTAGHKFVWDIATKQVLLLDEKGAVVFPEKATLGANYEDLRGAAKYIDVTAANADELKAAIIAGSKDIKLGADMTIETVIPVTAEIVLDLNGKTLSAPSVGRPFELADGASLTINAGDSTINCGKYGIINVLSGSDATITLNGGNYVANTDNGAFIKLRSGAGNVSITLDDVNYVDNSGNGYVMNVDGFEGELTIDVNGGSFKADRGFQVTDATAANFENVAIATNGVAINAHSDVTVKNCNITVGNGGSAANEGAEPVAAVAVSNGATATITGCTITGSYAYRVYPSGGIISASGNTLTDVVNEWFVHDLYEGKTATVTIDGTVVYPQ